MDEMGQANHLKAYGIAIAALNEHIKVDWLLNYQGGSYGFDDNKDMEQLCMQRGVTFTILSNHDYKKVLKEINSPKFNGAVKTLEKAPKIAVYTPPNKEPWDDAVTLALTYAEVPFEKIYVDEVLSGNLDKYDWVHLHHEDFTGQYGKFWSSYRGTDWYLRDKKTLEDLATKHGYKKVSQMQLAVVKKLRDFVVKGGNMFAMCSATETFDIALAAEGIDICDEVFDGDGIDENVNGKLNFSNCLAFTNFEVSTYRGDYRHSNIDDKYYRHIDKDHDFFYLFPFPSKANLVSSMLCQNHTDKISGFGGQTTGFRKDVLKPGTSVLGITGIQDYSGDEAQKNLVSIGEAKYLHGDYGKGTWTFYGGHDPEDYSHMVGDPPTDLSKYPHSAGYRLILNNVLFPAAQRNPVPTVVVGEVAHASSGAEQKSANNTIAAATQNSISIYPNPTNKDIIISFAQPAGTGGSETSKKIEHITVMNIEGKVFLNQSYSNETVQLDMSDYPAGLYLVQVNGVYSGNVIKR